MFTETECELCGKDFGPSAQVAEMVHEDDDGQGSLIVHMICGEARGFVTV